MVTLRFRHAFGGLLLAVVHIGALRSAAPATGNPAALPPTVPTGFTVQAVAAVPAPTSLAFSPDGATLYVASLAGFVFGFPVLGGTTLGPPTRFFGITNPIGVLATPDGIFASGIVNASAGSTGLVVRARDVNGDGTADLTETVIGGLPIGQHTTNGLAMGPDGMLYIANGSATDSGFEGTAPEVPPYSGSLLRVEPTAIGLTPTPEMVVATGWRNVYDVAFVPEGHPALRAGWAAVPVNGPDGTQYRQTDGTTAVRPAGEDSLDLLDVIDDVVEHFGFPWCLYDRNNGGRDGFTQDASEGACDPLPTAAFTGLVTPAQRAYPAALLGMHVSANGLAFNPGTNFPANMAGDLFIAEFGNFSGTEIVGHKIVRVGFNRHGGKVDAIETFMTGGLPLDVTFAPDGALWVADFGGQILRIAATPSNTLPPLALP